MAYKKSGLKSPVWVTGRITTSKGDCNSGNPKGVILTFIFYNTSDKGYQASLEVDWGPG